jgi:putative protease
MSLAVPTAATVAPPDTTARPRLPELLAPAGDWDCARAAVENGADAIYFGLERFNARIRAHNFTEADLPRLIEFLHRRGVRGYVCFNTLVFSNEVAEAERGLRAVIAAGVDAALVQDVGLCRLIRAMSPDFPIHASTQMSITSAAGVAFARGLGCRRAVLARECTLKDIERIRAGSSVPSVQGLGTTSFPLEVFVHGALCVAYSGQCLTSEALGGRSANRGECAQACRMPYELLADGQPVPLGDRRYLLSPQDLAGLELLPELVRLGLESVKIEGRLKTPEYVANITRIYRQALDRLATTLTTRASDRPEAQREDAARPDASVRYDMEMAFSRGLHTGWFGGINNQALVHGRFGKKRGVFLGEVRGVQKARVMVRLLGPLKPGDGVVFDAGRPDQPEEGGRVYEISSRPDGAWLSFGRGDLDLARVNVGDKLWKTSDPELERRLRLTYAGGQPRFQRPVTAEVHGRAGHPLTLVLRDGLGHVAEASSKLPLETAQNRPLDEDRLRAQFGRLGGTPFRLELLENSIEGRVMLPTSELNRLRREAVATLESLCARPLRWQLEPPAPTGSGAGSPSVVSPQSAPARTAPTLIVMVRNLDQLEAALRSGVPTIYCEFEDPKKYREAVSQFRQFHGRDAGAAQVPPSALPPGSPAPSLFVAPPRITKPGEEWMLKQVRSSEADGYLVRNFDHLEFFAGTRRVADFSLNIANHLAAKHFMDRFGFERLTASYDLNNLQLEALLGAAPPDWFEITIHHHVPMFHMEHCVFCAFLSTGTDFTNCGRPCDRLEVRLRDRVGAEHPVKADAGCRNTVFNALAQTGAEYVARLISLGARHFRLEFVNETPAQVAHTIEKYQRLLWGEVSGDQVWRELKVRHQLGVTRGPLDKGERHPYGF